MDSVVLSAVEPTKQQFCVEMMKGLDTRRKNDQFCDVILEVGSGDNQARLKAHKIVLCVASPFFDNALNSDMKEKKEGVIRLKETSKAAMEEILEYLYTGHVVINENNAHELLVKADYFLIPSLKVLSSKFILQTLTSSNCIAAYYLALKYRCEELLKCAKDFIHANFVSVAETEEFLHMSSREVQEWISSDEISIGGEEEVFEVVVKWIETNGCRNNLQCFYDLFQHVRLVYVPLNYLSKVILPHHFVTARKKCLDLALDAISCVSEGTEEHFFNQSPRKCLRTHEEIIVACGTRRTLCYLPFEEKWYQLADMLSPHNSYTTTLSTCHGKLYLFGGNLYSSTSERYEPSLNLWTTGKAPESDVLEARLSSAAATLQGFLYVVGGKSKSNDGKRLNTVQKYNPDTNKWQEVSPLSSPRSSVCAVADGSYLYAIGGMSETGKFTNIVERFNPTNNTWDKCRSTLARRRHAAGAAIKQKVFIFGGLRDHSAKDSCEVYDPTTNIWTGISSAVVPRGYTSAVGFKGHIYVFGCFQSEDGSAQEMSLRAYDVDNNRWLPGTKSFGSTFFKISRLRILRDVLLTCQTVAS